MPERRLVSVETIPGPIVRTTTTTRRIISNGAPSAGSCMYYDGEEMPIDGRQFIRELTPEVTRRVIYRGASVPPPASYTVREMVTPQVAPRITYYPPATYGTDVYTSSLPPSRRTIGYSSPSREAIMSAARRPLYTSVAYDDVDDYRTRAATLDRLRRQADSARTRMETDRYLSTPTAISATLPRRRSSVASLYDGIPSNIAATPVAEFTTDQVDTESTSGGIRVPASKGRAFNPQMSETRRRIRKVVCKSHDDPRYYDLD